MSGAGGDPGGDSDARGAQAAGGGVFTLTMTPEHALALSRCIVRYLSLPEAPLLPPAEESLVLQVYDQILDVVVPWVSGTEAIDGDEIKRRPVKGAGGEAR